VMEAFDQPWKERAEGKAGAYWGVYDADRNAKFEFRAPIVRVPGWHVLAAASVIASVVQPAEYEAIQQRLRELPEPPARARLSRTDWMGGLGVFLLVFLSTLPVVIPFLFVRNAFLALRISNAIAVTLLFVVGYAFGRVTGSRPWVTGIALVILGAALVAMTMALGG